MDYQKNMSHLVKPFVVLTIIMSFMACGTKESSRVYSDINQYGELVYQMDTLKIEIDDKTSYTYHRFDTFEEQDKFYLVRYQASTHSLLFFDLDKRKLAKTIKMDRGGPNGIGDVQNLYIHNLDSIFVFDIGNIKIMNDDAEVFYSMNIYASAPQEWLVSFASAEAKPFYQTDLKSIILKKSLRRSASEVERSEPFLVAVDLESRVFKLIGPQHADLMRDAEIGYGPYHGMNFTHTDSLILYNYPVSSSVYSYNLLTGENLEFDGEVSSISNQAAEFKNAPTQAFINSYRFETPVFYNVLYDPYRQLYYRLHRTGKDYDPQVNNTLIDTDFYLSVFNRKMEFLEEIELDKNTYSQFTAFVAPQGLALNASFKEFPLLEESNMIFHVFNFSFK